MTSKACMERPVVSADYSPQGRWETIAGLRTYIIGPEYANSAIVDVYDIIGIVPQTLQGADLLASLTQSLVFVPDFFEGVTAQIGWFPTDTDAKKAALGSWFKERADIQTNVSKLMEVRKEISEKWPAVDEHVGIFGLCWGGKISVTATGEGNSGAGRKFTVGGTAHPGMLNAKDAEGITVPYILLASHGEPVDVVAQYKDILSQPSKVGEVETYNTMEHGWMSARANLSDEANKKEYERGYEQVAAFFTKHM